MRYIDIGLRYQSHKRSFFAKLFSRKRRIEPVGKERVMLDQYFRVPQGTNKIVFLY